MIDLGFPKTPSCPSFDTSDDSYQAEKTEIEKVHDTDYVPPTSLKLNFQHIANLDDNSIYRLKLPKKIAESQITEFCKKSNLPADIFLNRKNIFVLAKGISQSFISYRHYSKKGENSSLTDVVKIITKFRNVFFRNLFLSYKRAQNDRQLIDWFMRIDPEAQLFSIEVFGDAHDRGKRPCLLTYKQNQSVYSVMYKPRNLTTDSSVCNLSDSIFKRLSEHPEFNKRLPLIKMYQERGKPYGYCEFIPHECQMNKKEKNDYYFCLGMIQCLSQCLGIADLHDENVIVAHGMPKLIDLEVSYETRVITYGHTTGLYSTVDPTDTQYKNWISLKGKNLYKPSKKDLNQVLDGFEYVRNFLSTHSQAFSRIVVDLMSQQRRLVPIATIYLSTKITSFSLDVKDSSTINSIYKEFILQVNNYYGIKVVLDAETKRKILENLRLDILHQDVPIFHCNNFTGEVLYHNLVLTKLTVAAEDFVKKMKYVSSLKIENSFLGKL